MTAIRVKYNHVHDLDSEISDLENARIELEKLIERKEEERGGLIEEYSVYVETIPEHLRNSDDKVNQYAIQISELNETLKQLRQEDAEFGQTLDLKSEEYEDCSSIVVKELESVHSIVLDVVTRIEESEVVIDDESLNNQWNAAKAIVAEVLSNSVSIRNEFRLNSRRSHLSNKDAFIATLDKLIGRPAEEWNREGIEEFLGNFNVAANRSQPLLVRFNALQDLCSIMRLSGAFNETDSVRAVNLLTNHFRLEM